MTNNATLSTKLLMDRDVQALSHCAFRLFVYSILKATHDGSDGVVSFRMLPTVEGWSGLAREEVISAGLELEEAGFYVAQDVRNKENLAKAYLLRSFAKYQYGELTPASILVEDVKTGRDLETYMRASLYGFHDNPPKDADFLQIYRSFIAYVPRSVRKNFTEHTADCACPQDDAPGGAVETCTSSTVTYNRKRASVATAERLEYRSVVAFVMGTYLADTSLNELRRMVDGHFAKSTNLARTALNIIDATFVATERGTPSVAYVNGILRNKR